MEFEKIVIQPDLSWKLIDLKEIWRYRELLFTFAWRDVKIRYKQTILGIFWVILQPLITTVIFTVFFGRVAKISAGNLPYSLFALSGLVFWVFFSNTLTNGANSMLNNESILKKVYFPKIILPISAILTNSVDFVINFIILLIFAVILGFTPSVWLLLILPIGLLLTSMTALGLSAFLAAMNVKYRDVRLILPFFIQILLFLTPVIYSMHSLSPQMQILLALNPMTLVVELTRSIFSSGNSLSPLLILTSCISSLFFLFAGLWYFRKTERFFADIV